MPISTEAHRQVTLRWDGALGRDLRSVVWLPTRGLRVGLRVRDAVVIAVYEGTLYRCRDCRRLCGGDVSRCLCEKKERS